MVAARSSATAVSRPEVPASRVPASPKPGGRFATCVPRSSTGAPPFVNAAPIEACAPMLAVKAESSSPPARPNAVPAPRTSAGAADATRAASASGFIPARATRVA